LIIIICNYLCHWLFSISLPLPKSDVWFPKH
jgi:hypothetical protein